MIKNYIFGLLTIITLSCRDNCEVTNQDVKSLMGANYKKEILFPMDMELVNLNMPLANVTVKKPYKIVYFFTADCKECINELAEIQSFLSENPIKDSVDFIFIASGPTNHFVAEAVENIKFEYAVFYEKIYFSFKNMNDLELDQVLYNTMILNNQNKVLLFGSYFFNQKAQRLFSDILKCGL